MLKSELIGRIASQNPHPPDLIGFVGETLERDRPDRHLVTELRKIVARCA